MSMDACIARGGISHVLSQARASLKNPSRPFTPRTTGRPLFHGDDYRPGSRPSSSTPASDGYQEAIHVKMQASGAGPTPSPALSSSRLPPRAAPTRKPRGHTSNSMPVAPPASRGPTSAMTASPSQVKLMQAPVLDRQLDDEEEEGKHEEKEADELLSERSDADEQDDRGNGHHHPHCSQAAEDDPLEASLEIPSTEKLAATLLHLQQELHELSTKSPLDISSDNMSAVSTAIAAFTASTSLFVDPHRAAKKNATSSSNRWGRDATVVVAVRHQRHALLTALCELLLSDPWASSARAMLALTPPLLELYLSDPSRDEDADSQVVALGKALFLLSKESENDSEFCNVRFVESALALIVAMNECVLHSPRASVDASSLPPSSSSSTSSSSPSPWPLKLLIYLAGTLKNVSSGEDRMLKLLATNGAIAALSDTLLWRGNSDSHPNRHDGAIILETKEVAQFLIQATYLLRNLSASKSCLKQFNQALVTARLCELVTPPFVAHQELMVNVSRILGKVTLHEAPRAQINQRRDPRLRNLLHLVDPARNPALSLTSVNDHTVLRDCDAKRDHHGTATPRAVHPESRSQDVLLVRIFFVLGNLCAGNDRDRQYVGIDEKALPSLLQCLRFYGQQYVAAEAEECASKRGRDGTDVLVKLVRLLANLAINADVAQHLNTLENKQQHHSLVMLLDVLQQAQMREDEELMLNIVSCITNLSYFASPTTTTATATGKQEESFMDMHRVRIAQQLVPILWDRNEEAVVEATRAFGNLSRFADVLHVMHTHKVLDCLVILLDHSHREIVYTVCGVLMNAALDDGSRQRLLRGIPVASPSPTEDKESEAESTQRTRKEAEKEIDACGLLVGILECAALDDIEMSCIASKVLHNLLVVPRASEAPHYNGDAMDKSDREQQVITSAVSENVQRVVNEILTALGRRSDGATQRRRWPRQDDDCGEELTVGEDECDLQKQAERPGWTRRHAELWQVLTKLERYCARSPRQMQE